MAKIRPFFGNILRALPLGLGVPVLAVMATSRAGDVGKNLASWATALGWNNFAEWVTVHITGARLIWGIVIFLIVYVVIVWGLPTFIRRAEQNRVAVVVPLVTVALIALVIIALLIVQTPAVTWEFPEEQQQALRTAVEKTNTNINMAIYPVPGAPSDAVAFAYDLMHVFDGANTRKFKIAHPEASWSVAVVPFDAYNSPLETGIQIAVPTHTDPTKNQNAKVLKSVLEKAGFQPTFNEDNRLQDHQVTLVVGKHP